MIDENDWRLRDQESHLLDAQLVRRPWRESRPGWDHDHCEFCYAEFSDSRYPEAMHQGYCTPDEYRWICDRCFEDFKSRFRFNVLQEDRVPTLDELRQRCESH